MIDLHTHTNCSDGTYTAQRLVLEASEMGLEALAICDHDTLEGYDLAKPFAASADVFRRVGLDVSVAAIP